MSDYPALPSTIHSRPFDPYRRGPLVAASDTAVLIAPAAAAKLALLGGDPRALIDAWIGPGAVRCDLGGGLALWHAPAATEPNPAAAALADRTDVRGTALVTGADTAGRPVGINRIQAARLVTDLRRPRTEPAPGES